MVKFCSCSFISNKLKLATKIITFPFKAYKCSKCTLELRKKNPNIKFIDKFRFSRKMINGTLERIERKLKQFDEDRRVL